jgi:hypothetical protein
MKRSYRYIRKTEKGYDHALVGAYNWPIITKAINGSKPVSTLIIDSLIQENMDYENPWCFIESEMEFYFVLGINVYSKDKKMIIERKTEHYIRISKDRKYRIGSIDSKRLRGEMKLYGLMTAFSGWDWLVHFNEPREVGPYTKDDCEVIAREIDWFRFLPHEGVHNGNV